MATNSHYNGYEISWRETGEQFVALVQKSGGGHPPAIVTATVAEGMVTLKSRTLAIIDADAVGAYRPNMSLPHAASPVRSFATFLSHKERELGELLCATSEIPERLSAGWAFYYQSRSYVETKELSKMLVGHGPVVITDEGEIIEGGSLFRDPETLLRR